MKKTLSEKSVSSYQSQIKRLLRWTEAPSLCNVINHKEIYHPKLIKAIEEEYEEATDYDLKMVQLQILKALLAVMKHASIKEHHHELYESWYAEFEPLNKLFIQQRESNEPTEKQLSAMLDWEQDVIPKWMHLHKYTYASHDHLLLSMYVLLPPRRQVDYYKVRILQPTETFETAVKQHDTSLSGYIDLQTKQIMIVQGKTVQSYAEWVKDLPTDLMRILRASIRKYPRDYLFLRPSDNLPFSSATTFTKYNNQRLKEIFENSNISVNSLRHAFATFVHACPMKSLASLKEVSKDMGHSVLTNMSYVLKRSKPISSHKT